MSYASVLEHMNAHHKENLIALVKKYANESAVIAATLVGVDDGGLDVEYVVGVGNSSGENGKDFGGKNSRENNASAADSKNDAIGTNGAKRTARINFLKRTDEAGLKDAVIALCATADDETGKDFARIREQIAAFRRGFNSVTLATANKNGAALCTYAPFVETAWGGFIYVSEVAEHCASLRDNPTNIEVMFLEDESRAAAVIFRKRLRYRATATFIPRGELFDKVFDQLEANLGGGAIKTIRQMLDFHLVRLDFGKGRFVKGPGQAYDIDGEKITHATGGAAVGGNPHKFAHRG